MNTSTYIEKIKGMLHDETFYKSPIKKLIDEILQIVLNGKLTNVTSLYTNIPHEAGLGALHFKSQHTGASQ